MHAYKCPICGSTLNVKLYYHEVVHFEAKYYFEKNQNKLNLPTEIENNDDDDHYIFERILLICPNCDFKHTIEVSEYYPTLEGIFEDADDIVDKEYRKNIKRG